MITINSDRLRINVACPGDMPNNTCRFDRAGFITDITLDKKHQFCVSEPTNLVHPTTGGRGLCNEFNYDAACEEAEVGQKFPKFGIGLFTKPDERPFCFYRKYDVEPYPISWTQTENSVSFKTEELPCLGYALREEKNLRVEANVLTITITLENVGEKELNMAEYCHNFLTIDELPLGPDYQIELPGAADRGYEIVNGTIKGNGKGFTFSDYNAKAAMLEIEEKDIISDPFVWKMKNAGSPIYIEVTEHFKPCKISMWAINNIISVEAFRRISLKHGEKTEWTRSWLFGAK